MRAIDLLRHNFAMTESWTMPILEDLQKTPLAAATPGGNHALWIFGHLTFCEGLIVRQFVLGEPNEFANWMPILGPESRPEEDADAYPSWEEVATSFRQARDRTLAWLETQNDDDLDLPCKAPPKGMEAAFANRGAGISLVITHWCNHRGQLCDIRKALGRRPIFR
ncbi:DinB family protein [Blastopirellula marina]|uniref:DinB-like domain-containing protein n=1 Tax=Blastopirellula marina DSM 3645 TaxID=314230 RepID=A3ZRQ7_9BACT|nr:DinB family protein [Blastopirellula marina]EAQ80826.1 hypothetical protein DSM3645_12436 [Blastopirellula marina DSM 3645]